MSFEEDKKTVENEKPISTIDLIKKEMKRLGLKNLDEYIKLVSLEDNNDKSNDDFTM